jgi:hypothetical protein
MQGFPTYSHLIKGKSQNSKEQNSKEKHQLHIFFAGKTFSYIIIAINKPKGQEVKER